MKVRYILFNFYMIQFAHLYFIESRWLQIKISRLFSIIIHHMPFLIRNHHVNLLWRGMHAQIPCDGLLISGSLIVNESMLTGLKNRSTSWQVHFEFLYSFAGFWSFHRFLEKNRPYTPRSWWQWSHLTNIYQLAGLKPPTTCGTSCNPPKKAAKWRGEPMPVAKVPVENVENYEIRAKGNKTYAGMGEVGENVL